MIVAQFSPADGYVEVSETAVSQHKNIQEPTLSGIYNTNGRYSHTVCLRKYNEFVKVVPMPTTYIVQKACIVNSVIIIHAVAFNFLFFCYK